MPVDGERIAIAPGISSHKFPPPSSPSIGSPSMGSRRVARASVRCVGGARAQRARTLAERAALVGVIDATSVALGSGIAGGSGQIRADGRHMYRQARSCARAHGGSEPALGMGWALRAESGVDRSDGRRLRGGWSRRCSPDKLPAVARQDLLKHAALLAGRGPGPPPFRRSVGRLRPEGVCATDRGRPGARQNVETESVELGQNEEYLLEYPRAAWTFSESVDGVQPSIIKVYSDSD